MTTASGLPKTLIEWIEACTATAVRQAQRVAAGGRRHGYVIWLDDGSDRPTAYLAVEPDDATAADRASGLRLEAEVFRKLYAAGVRVPEVKAVHPTIDAMLMGLVPGQSAFARLSDDDKTAVSRDFMLQLAAAHSVDPRVDPIAELTPTGSAEHHVREFIATWEAAYRHGPHGADPLMELGLVWLKANVPSTDRPVAYIQGDTGPGNFMFDQGKVTAIVDWELAHLGDPLEDLGWLSMRCAQDPFPDFATRVAEYCQASGLDLDLEAIRYYRVLAEWTIALIGHTKSSTGLGDSERGNAFIFEHLHRRLMVEAIAEYHGLELEPVPAFDDRTTTHTWMYDMAADQMRESVLVAIDDSLATRRAKGVARTIKYLREVDKHGQQAQEREMRALADALGYQPTDLVSGRRELADQIASGTTSVDAALAYAWVRVSLDNHLHGPAMGRLKDRHLAPLTHES